MMKKIFIFFLLLFDTSFSAASVDTLLAIPAEIMNNGTPLQIIVYVHNNSAETITFSLPNQLSCSIRAGEISHTVIAHLVEEGISEKPVLDPGNFIKAAYTIELVENLSGPVFMVINNLDANPVMFSVSKPSAAPTDLVSDESSGQERDFAKFDSFSTLYQPYLVNIAPYEPIYFLVGTDPGKSKFQISFKYRFFSPEGTLVKKLPWLEEFHFGYTQTSFWDLESASAPFEDTSYKPELFFLTDNIESRPSWLDGFFIQTGVLHESNGLGGINSRSTNIFYVKPYFILTDFGKGIGLQIAPKILGYIRNDGITNQDLPDYRGHFELETKFGKDNGFVLASYLRLAEQGPSVQFDLTYPIHRFLGYNLDLYLQAQYANALAESLLYYRKRTESLRLGFSIVR